MRAKGVSFTKEFSLEKATIEYYTEHYVVLQFTKAILGDDKQSNGLRTLTHRAFATAFDRIDETADHDE